MTLAEAKVEATSFAVRHGHRLGAWKRSRDGRLEGNWCIGCGKYVMIRVGSRRHDKIYGPVYTNYACLAESSQGENI